MLDFINELLHNVVFFRIGVVVTVVFTILLIVLLFLKSSRDERGRAIIGRASTISTIVFIVLVNVFAKMSRYIEFDYLSTSNSVQWIYNIVIVVESIGIMIFKKIN